MSNRIVAVYARHTLYKDEVCFVVVAESLDRMGWPVIAAFGSLVMERYTPLRVVDLGPAPDRDVTVVDIVGPGRSLPCPRQRK